MGVEASSLADAATRLRREQDENNLLAMRGKMPHFNLSLLSQIACDKVNNSMVICLTNMEMELGNLATLHVTDNSNIPPGPETYRNIIFLSLRCR